MLTIQGKGVSSGISIGPLHFFHRTSRAIIRRKVTDTSAEWRRFTDAQTKAMEELGKLADKARSEVGEEVALLFETHQMMAEDLDYVEAIQTLIEDGLNAEAAVTDVSVQFAQMFASMDDAYMQARAADVKDVSARIVAILQDLEENDINSDTPVILVADDLTPSETVQLDKRKLLGFVTSGGSSSGHTAILARTMGIPAIIGVGDGLKPEYEGREAIIDGATGQVVLEADPLLRDSMLKKRAEQMILKQRLEGLKGAENITLDGRKINIYCNIGSPDDVSAVKVNDGGGVGLFRSEFLYLACEDYPTEDQLFEAYRSAVTAMEGKTVIIRTLDIGADKQVDYFGLQIETPAAVLISDRLAKEADFFSIGTNDLIQYTLACDRQCSTLGKFYDPHHPAVLRAIKIVVDNAHKYGKWAGICGELGADLELTPLFLSIGVDELSVTPDMVLSLRAVIRETNVGKVREKLLAELLPEE